METPPGLGAQNPIESLDSSVEIGDGVNDVIDLGHLARMICADPGSLRTERHNP
jgi:hypothetical protein